MAKVPEAFERIFAKRPDRWPDKIKPGLDRILAAWDCLGRPAASIPAVLVAGTNGKGTTSGFLWQILTAAGLDVGLYTSPHLISLAERIQTSRRKITEEDLVRRIRDLEEALPKDLWESMSFFEVATAMALALFEDHGLDAMVLEVGLGGRWDATNVIDPRVSVITSIGLDHPKFLGTDPAGIAREKSGIMRGGRPVIWAGPEGGTEAADRAIREEAKARGASLFEPDPDQPFPLATGPGYLRGNFRLAVMAAKAFFEDQGLSEKLSGAVETVVRGEIPRPPSLWGRFETRRDQGGREWLLDVCHNVDGARAFAEALREEGPVPLPGFVSILEDKDVNGILDVLREVLGPLTLFASKGERGFRREQLAERHQDLPWFGSFAEASTQHPESGPAVVCGSVAVVGEVLQSWESPL